MSAMQRSLSLLLLVLSLYQQLHLSKAGWTDPPPRWRCPYNFAYPVYDYRGLKTMDPRQVCRASFLNVNYGTIITVDDVQGGSNTCLNGFITAIGNTSKYAIDMATEIKCYTPCEDIQCVSSCIPGEAVNVVCKANYAVGSSSPARDFQQCPELNSPQNGRVDFPNGRRYWSFARYKCEGGYILNDSKPVFCDQDTSWVSYPMGLTGTAVPAVPKSCIPDPLVPCMQLPTVPNGFLKVIGGGLADVVCNKGYQAVNGRFASRLVNGIWTKLTGRCEVTNCQLAKTFCRGFLHITTTLIGSTAFAICSANYKFEGDPDVKCGRDGEWADVNGSCQAICPCVEHVNNGVVVVTNNTVNATAEIRCFQEFILLGDPTVRCQENGTWSSFNGSCEAVCPSITYINNGIVYGADTTVNATAEIRCFQNFTFSGDPTVHCQADGTWSSSNGSCEAICPFVEHVNNGVVYVTSITYINNGIVYGADTSVNATAEIRCFQNFSFFGDPTVHCQADGTWSSLNGSCEAICPFVQHVNNGVVFVTNNTVNSTAEIKCFQNYTLVGDPTVRCQANGTWSSFNGSCEVACSSAQFIRNGLLIIKERTVQAQAEASCFENFTIDGTESTVECQKDSTWSSPRVSCLAPADTSTTNSQVYPTTIAAPTALDSSQGSSGLFSLAALIGAVAGGSALGVAVTLCVALLCSNYRMKRQQFKLSAQSLDGRRPAGDVHEMMTPNAAYGVSSEKAVDDHAVSSTDNAIVDDLYTEPDRGRGLVTL